MKKEEFEQILLLLDEIRQIVAEKFNNVYMPQFNALGGKEMHALPTPIPFSGRISLNDLNGAIQETNIAYVYLLNNAVTRRATIRQWIHDRYGFEQKIIDGVNYMSSLTNEIILGKGTIQELPLDASVDKLIYTLQEILRYLDIWDK